MNLLSIMGGRLNPASPTWGVNVKTRIVQSKSGKSLLVTFHEGFSTYTITVPMPYAIRFFVNGFHSALETLHQNKEMLNALAENDTEKFQIQDQLKKSLVLFDDFLKSMGR
jgi:hypothetical protein